MDKKQNFHIRIKNTETKKSEDFMIASNNESPLKAIGADNVALKYQIGKIEYGDLTNHNIWAQSDWSEGGGKEFWEPYRDGYNVYPYTKKYFSKSGLRTVDYPGKIVLGANAIQIENFPERTGTIACIEKYQTRLFVAVNLEDSCKIYETRDGGLTWLLIYSSADQDGRPDYDLSSCTKIFSMKAGVPDATNKNLSQRQDPTSGSIIPLNTWDKWYKERRQENNAGFLYITLRRPSDNFGCLIKIPLSTNTLWANCKQHGIIMEPITKKYEVVTAHDDYDSEFSGVLNEDVYVDEGTPYKYYRRITVNAEDKHNFFVGQKIIVLQNTTETTVTIVGINGNDLIVNQNLFNYAISWIKLSPSTKVLELDNPISPLLHGKDFQGNSIETHPFDFEIRNLNNNKISFVQNTGGNLGACNRNVIANTYNSYEHIGQTNRGSSNGAGEYYIYYREGYWEQPEGNPTPPPIWHPLERFHFDVEAETRNYVVVEENVSSFSEGDYIEVNKVISTNETITAYPLVNLYRRKTTTIRNQDVFFTRTGSMIARLTYPCDLNYKPFDDLNHYSTWFNVTGEVTTMYVDEANRELALASRNLNVVQAYIYQADDSTTGTAAAIFDVGELLASTIVKHNESIYVGTNDKGRIYEWNGQTYKVLERFTLDAATNDHLIMASEKFMNKILFTDNYNGIIMTYDPEEDVWDDLCAPEYIKNTGDLITSFGIIGGTLFFGTNRNDSLLWKFEEKLVTDRGHLVSSWYSADMPAISKKGLYVQILTQEFIKSGAKLRLAVQFDYKDKWYYLPKERNQLLTSDPTSLQTLSYSDLKADRTFYFFFPYNTPRWKTCRYRLEIIGGPYRTVRGKKGFFRPVVNNVDIFYILSDPKEFIFSYPIILENRMQTLGGYGSNEIGRHRDKLDFLLDIWNNDTICEITHIDGKKYTCIPFKPQQSVGGGLSVVYNNLDVSRKDLDELSYFTTISFKNINAIDVFGK